LAGEPVLDEGGPGVAPVPRVLRSAKVLVRRAFAAGAHRKGSQEEEANCSRGAAFNRTLRCHRWRKPDLTAVHIVPWLRGAALTGPDAGEAIQKTVEISGSSEAGCGVAKQPVPGVEEQTATLARLARLGAVPQNELAHLARGTRSGRPVRHVVHC